MDNHPIRAIIFYEHQRNSSTRQATDNINGALGKGTVSHSTVGRWLQRFATGDKSLEDRYRSGRPVELEDENHPDASMREIEQALSHSHSTIHDRLLAAAIQKKRRRRIEVCLLHNNARPHVASATRQQLEKLSWTTVFHPPYSPDLAPSDLHLFRSLKNYMRN
jgi:transposase